MDMLRKEAPTKRSARKQKTIAIKGSYVWAIAGGEPTVLRDCWVVVEGRRIAAIAKRQPAGVDRAIDAGKAFILPGLLNLHNHIISSVAFRGITEDKPRDSATGLVYKILLPLGDFAVESLPEADLRAIVELGMLEVLKGGTTTLMEVFRPQQEVTVAVAIDMGIRLYAASYLFSTSKMSLGQDGKPRYESRNADQFALDRWKEFHARHDGAADGRIRVALAPHGTDSCGPELLRDIRNTADEYKALITIHLSQTKAEPTLIRQRYGKTPEEYLRDTGLLGPDLLVAHCVETEDPGLDILKRTDTTIVCCPLTYARGGCFAPFGRFRGKGIRTAIGTDGYCMDMVSELRAAGYVSKLFARDSMAATAHDLLHAATLGGAEALGRNDLGRIAPGACADLIVIDMARPHLQPVSDPIRTLIWNARGSDVTTVMVGGRTIVENGRYKLGRETEIVERGARAVHKLWKMAEAEGVFEQGAVTV
jgi:cytosine/adenosine deaminase-related metal-dependent hydrolase